METNKLPIQEIIVTVKSQTMPIKNQNPFHNQTIEFHKKGIA